jgi:hypothetical protein
MKKVSASTLSQWGSGTLIQAFDTLDEVNGDDTDRLIQAAQLQARISQELEQRGWVYDETVGEWVSSL